MRGSPPPRYLILGILLISTILYFLPASSRQPARPSLSSVPSIPKDVPLRILPLGDSVTWGYNDPTGNSYRRFLDCLLHGAGITAQYVGSKHNGDWPNDANHGLTLHGLALLRYNITGADMAEVLHMPHVNVVLLHGGSVDFQLPHVVMDDMIRDLDLLVDDVVRLWPDALVLVAQIIMHRDPRYALRITEYNARVPDIVRRKQWEGKRVMLASMVGVQDADLLDGVHPNAGGYLKMARRWYQPVVDAYNQGLITPLPLAEAKKVRRAAASWQSYMMQCPDVLTVANFTENAP